MSQLLIIDGGSRTLDLSQCHIGHIYKPEIRAGRRVEQLWLFFDDRAKEERLVLQLLHRSTHKGNEIRGTMSDIKLTSIFGYDPQKNRWGPTERHSDMQITFANGKRLVQEMTAHIHATMNQFNGGAHWYAPAAKSLQL